MRTELGRIARAEFGFGGYQEAMLGISWTIEGKGWGVGDFWGAWGIDRSDFAKWTEEERVRELGLTCMRLRDILRDAKKDRVSQLVGTPVQVELDGNLLKSWRVLAEVL